jgi:hypothetical protein
MRLNTISIKYIFYTIQTSMALPSVSKGLPLE